jgi:hypothetical protein
MSLQPPFNRKNDPLNRRSTGGVTALQPALNRLAAHAYSPTESKGRCRLEGGAP